MEQQQIIEFLWFYTMRDTVFIHRDSSVIDVVLHDNAILARPAGLKNRRYVNFLGVLLVAQLLCDIVRAQWLSARDFAQSVFHG